MPLPDRAGVLGIPVKRIRPPSDADTTPEIRIAPSRQRYGEPYRSMMTLIYNHYLWDQGSRYDCPRNQLERRAPSGATEGNRSSSSPTSFE